jgi:exosome complex component RRP42
MWRIKNKMDKIRTTPNVTGERIKKYLQEGKRFDGRKPEEFRKLTIEKNISIKAEGSVRVRLGKTEVIVGVKMAPGEPYPDSPASGNLMVTAEMLPLSSPRFESGPPKIEAIEWARVTDRGIRESGFVDFDKLCIKEGEKVWTVFVDIYSINDDGNLMDAATIGAIAAMKITKIPKYDLEKDKVLYDEPTDKGLPLTDHVPVAVTVHKIGDSLIVDPTKEEEDMSETRVTIGSSKGIISSLQKSDSRALEIEEMKKIFEISTKVSEKIDEKINEALK